MENCCLCDILSWLTRLPNVVCGNLQEEVPFRAATSPENSHPTTSWMRPKSLCSQWVPRPLVTRPSSARGRVHAALDLREKTESSTPTPRDPSLSLQAGSVPGLEEKGRVARGIELERCPVRARSREKHPVRGSRQSADSRQVTRDDTIQEGKEGNWGEAYVGAIFPGCRLRGGCWVVEFAKDQEENSLGGHEKKLQVPGKKWGHGTEGLRA